MNLWPEFNNPVRITTAFKEEIMLKPNCNGTRSDRLQ